MAIASPAAKVDVSAALTALKPLGVDQYCIAFGPGATQFCATSNGYSTAQLPRKVVKDLLGGQIMKVLHASFGSDANSFFFTYQMKDGSVAHRAGRDIPTTLRSFVDRASTTSKEQSSSLRVQLGANRSYVAWTGPLWISRGVPGELRAVLHCISKTDFDHANGSQGVLKSGTLDNIAWHNNGGCYVKNGEAQMQYLAGRGAKVLRDAWRDMSQDEFSQGMLEPKCPSNLAYIAINPHSPTGGTFAFIKKAKVGHEPEFILRFEPEDVVSRLYKQRDPLPSMDTVFPHGYGEVVNVPKNTEGLQVFQWAVSKHTGRSHVKDSWEIDLKKGEQVKILKYMGKDWFLVENRRKEIGWVHRAWLNISAMIPHVDPQEAYARFTVDTEKIFEAGKLRSFPVMSLYMNACAKDACSSWKKGTRCLGICIHDLHELMRGSGSGEYGLETLKLERNKWHPDKFARFCHPDHRDALKEKAQELFVLFGVLMDMLENPRASKPAT